MADKCNSTMAAVSENRRGPQEGNDQNNTSLERSAVGSRKPIVAGMLGDIKGVNHMRNDTQAQPDSTGGKCITGRTGRAGR